MGNLVNIGNLLMGLIDRVTIVDQNWHSACRVHVSQVLDTLTKNVSSLLTQRVVEEKIKEDFCPTAPTLQGVLKVMSASYCGFFIDDDVDDVRMKITFVSQPPLEGSMW